MNTVSAVLINASLATAGPAFSAEVVEVDPWTRSPGIVIIDQISGGFTSEYSSADKPDSLNRLAAQMSYQTQTASSLPTISSRAFEAITTQLRALRRSEAVNTCEPVENILEAQRLTGLNWSQISDLLDVDRRSVYNWLQGGLIRQRNVERIARLLSVLRYIDEGSIELNQRKLFEADYKNASVYDLLCQARFEDLGMIARYGRGRANEGWAPQDHSVLRDYGLPFAPEGFLIDDTSDEEVVDPKAALDLVSPKRRKARKV